MADKFFLQILRTLNEAQARWYVAQKAIALGRGGVKAMQELTGMSRPTILRGIRELKRGELPEDRVRSAGGGRKRLERSDPGLTRALKRIMEENTAGDPMNLLRWTHKSTTAIAEDDPSCGTKKAAGVKDTPLPEAAPGTTPEFSCTTLTAKMDDLWTGKKIVPKWTVTNTGTGDLSLKIKGG